MFNSQKPNLSNNAVENLKNLVVVVAGEAQHLVTRSLLITASASLICAGLVTNTVVSVYKCDINDWLYTNHSQNWWRECGSALGESVEIIKLQTQLASGNVLYENGVLKTNDGKIINLGDKNIASIKLSNLEINGENIVVKDGGSGVSLEQIANYIIPKIKNDTNKQRLSFENGSLVIANNNPSQSTSLLPVKEIVTTQNNLVTTSSIKLPTSSLIQSQSTNSSSSISSIISPNFISSSATSSLQNVSITIVGGGSNSIVSNSSSSLINLVNSPTIFNGSIVTNNSVTNNGQVTNNGSVTNNGGTVTTGGTTTDNLHVTGTSLFDGLATFAGGLVSASINNTGNFIQTGLSSFNGNTNFTGAVNFSTLPSLPLAFGNVFLGNTSNIASPALLDTSIVPENGNLYFTNSRAIGSNLTGFLSGVGTITSADSVLSAIQKLDGNNSLTNSNLVTTNSNLILANANITNLTSGLATTNTNVNNLQTGLNAANTNVATNTNNIANLTTGLNTTNSNLAGNTILINTLNAGLATTNNNLTLSNSNIATIQTGLVNANSNIAQNSANILALQGLSHNPVTIGTGNGLTIDLAQVLSLALANGTTNGALSSPDWNVFNNKQNALIFGNLTAASNKAVITGGTGAVIGAGATVDVNETNLSLQNIGGALSAAQQAGINLSNLTGSVNLATQTTGILPLANLPIVPVANGGTGATTATGARSNLGLGNVDNTNDLNKPLSTATIASLAGKFNTPTGTTTQYIRGDGSVATLDTSVVPENGNLYFTNSRVIGSTLTSYISGAGTISPTDSLLSAIQKLNGNNDQTNTQVATNTSNITTNTSNIVGNTTSISNLTTGLATTSGNIATNTANIAQNTSDITALQNSLATTNTNVSNLTTNLAATITTLTAAQTDITNLQSGLATTNNNLTLANSNITVLQTGLSTANNNIAQNSVDILALQGLSHPPVTISTANGLSIDPAQVLSLALANASTNGALSSTDWSIFNNKQDALNVSNGLTLLGNNLKLGGALTQPTTFGTSVANTFSLTGLQSGLATDSILVQDASGVVKNISPSTLLNGSTTNLLSLTGNTLTSTVNGIVAASNIIGSNTLTSAGNTLESLVNGVSTGTQPIINSNAVSTTGNLLTSTVNGVISGTTPLINSNTSALVGTSLINTINGVATAPLDLTPAILAGSTNVLTSTGNVLNSNVNGISQNANIINSGALTSTGNTISGSVNGVSLGSVPLVNSILNTTLGNNLSTTVNGIAGSDVSIINSNSLVSSGNTLESLVNGVSTGVQSIINSNAVSTTGNLLTSTVNGVVSGTTPIINSNGLSLLGSNLTSSVNGIVSAPLDLTALLTGATTNTLGLSGNTLTSTVNGVVAISNAVGSNTLTSTGNTLESLVNGVSTGTQPIINSNLLISSGNTLSSSVNGFLTDIAPIINSNTSTLSGTSLINNINGIATAPLDLSSLQSTANNGLTAITGNVQLGGPLVQNTNIDGEGIYDLTLVNLNNGSFTTSNTLSLYGSQKLELTSNQILNSISPTISMGSGPNNFATLDLNQIALGQDNSLNSANQFVTGLGNQVQGNNAFVTGTNNNFAGAVGSTELYINGSNNSFGSPSGVSNLYITGAGNSVTSSNFTTDNVLLGFNNNIQSDNNAYILGTGNTVKNAPSASNYIFGSNNVSAGTNNFSIGQNLNTQRDSVVDIGTNDSTKLTIENSGRLTLRGPLAPNGDDGIPGQVLISNGSGSVPFWGTAFSTANVAVGNGLTNNVSTIQVLSPTCISTQRLSWNGTNFVCTLTTNTLTSTANALTNTTNGVAATANIINTNAVSTSGNNLTSTVNGVASTTTPIINTNGLSLSGSNLTSTVNGIASTALNLAPLLTGSTTNTLGYSAGTLTSTVNGVVSTATIPNANTITTGLFTSTDWNTFNTKVGNINTTGVASGINITGTAVNPILNINGLTATACTSGQKLTWNGTAMSCAIDVDTLYTAGTGLSLTGTTFANTGVLSLNSAGTTGLTLTNSATTGSITQTLAGTLGISNGGTGLTTIGTAGQVLTSNGTTLSWATPTTGVTTLTAIGSIPNANGGTIASNALTLQPASAAFGGVVTTGIQSFGGAKTFVSPTTTFDSGTATADTFVIQPNTAIGTSFAGTLTTANLSSPKTWTLPDVSGSVCISGAGTCVASGVAATGVTGGASLTTATTGLSITGVNNLLSAGTVNYNLATGIGSLTAGVQGATGGAGTTNTYIGADGLTHLLPGIPSIGSLPGTLNTTQQAGLSLSNIGGALNLATQTTGVLPLANGGTGTALLSGTAGQILTSNGAGGTQWSTTTNDWSINGNAGTAPATNYIGTSDAQNLSVRTNGLERINIGSGTPAVVNVKQGVGNNQLLFGNTVAGTNLFIGSSTQDFFWQSGFGQQTQYGSYHGIDISGGRTSGAALTQISGSAGQFNTRILNTQNQVGLITQAGVAAPTLNATEIRNLGGTTQSAQTFSGTSLNAAGTVALPAYSFLGNSNTGIYNPAANTLGISTNGSQQLTILPSGQAQLNKYTAFNSFTGTAIGGLGYDSSGNILSVPVPTNGATSLITPTGSNANGGSVTGGVLTLSLADTINPGLISATAQTIGGSKTFVNPILEGSGVGTGLATAPQYSFNGNTNTGIYNPATNTLGISTNGSQQLTVLPSGQIQLNKYTAFNSFTGTTAIGGLGYDFSGNLISVPVPTNSVTSLATPSGSNTNGGSVTGGVLTLSLADTANPGVLSPGNFTNFNNKENALTFAGNGLFSRTGNSVFGLSCTTDQIPKWTGSAFQCGIDNGTTFTVGSGLNLSGTNVLSRTPGTVFGDMQYWNGTSWTTLNAGTSGQILGIASSAPAWINNNIYSGNTGIAQTGTVFSLNGLTGTPCTATQKLTWSGSALSCATDIDTTNTYTAGTGLSLTGTTFANTGLLSIATSTGATGLTITPTNTAGAVTQTLTGTLTTNNGGTGLTTLGTAGQVLTSNGTTLSYVTPTTGILSLTAAGAAPNANSGSITGTALTLQPADATNPGIVSTVAQVFGGNKNFINNVRIGDNLAAGSSLDLVANGVGTPSLRILGKTGSIYSNFEFNNTNTPGANNWGIYANGTGATNAGSLNLYNPTTPSGNLIIDGTGNVGIGLNAPTSRFQVAGNIAFSGDLRPNNLPGTTGQILTSQGAGVAPIWTNNNGANAVTSLTTPSGSNANGGSIASNALTLSLANATNPGIVSTAAQTFAGDKTFNGNIFSTNIYNGSGTAAAPSYAFNSAGNTGLYLPSSSSIGFSNAGVSNMTLGATGNLTLSGVNRNITGTASLTLDTNSGNINFNPLGSGATGNVIIGSGTPSGSSDLLVLDNKNTAGDPTGLAGATYYNSNLGAFRCFTTVWSNCNTGSTYTAGVGLSLTGTTFANTGVLGLTAADTSNIIGGTTSNPTVSINLTATGIASTATTASGSGLEVSSGISLLRGCTNDQVLKWNNITKAWACANDSSVMGTDVIATKSTALTAAMSDTPQIVVYNTETQDINAGHNNTTGVYTTPAGGTDTYTVEAQLGFTTAGLNMRIPCIGIRRAGVIISSNCNADYNDTGGGSVGGRNSVAVSATMVLTAGQTVDVVTFTSTNPTAGTAPTFDTAAAGANYLNIKRIGNALNIASDINLKKEIKSFNLGLKDLMDINTVSYLYNGKAVGAQNDGIEHVGIIAQDLQRTSFGQYAIKEGTDGFLRYDPTSLLYATINGVKELNTGFKQNSFGSANLSGLTSIFGNNNSNLLTIAPIVADATVDEKGFGEKLVESLTASLENVKKLISDITNRQDSAESQINSQSQTNQLNQAKINQLENKINSLENRNVAPNSSVASSSSSNSSQTASSQSSAQPPIQSSSAQAQSSIVTSSSIASSSNSSIASSSVLSSESSSSSVSSTPTNSTVTLTEENIFQKLITLLNDLVVKGTAFINDLVVKGTTIFQGRVEFEDIDAGGFVNIPQGQTEVEVIYAKAYNYKPVVTLTVEEVAITPILKDSKVTGFKVKLPAAQSTDIVINWTAKAVKGAIAPTVSAPVSSSAQLSASSLVSTSSNSSATTITSSIMISSAISSMSQTQNSSTTSIQFNSSSSANLSNSISSQI